MNSTKVIFVASLLMLLSGQTQSQSDYRGCYGFDCKEKKWSISLFAGFSILGPGQKIEEQMIVSGLGDVGPDSDLSDWFKVTDYPTRSVGTSWNVSVAYDISNKIGLQLTGGNSFSSVEGYDDIGSGNSLLIKSSIWTTSFNGIYKLRKGKDGFKLGPVLANYSTTADNLNVYANQVTQTSTLKAGFNAGYAFSLIRKKSWFLTANTNYTWLPNADIGPYTIEHEREVYPSETIKYTSTFSKTDVPLSHFSFGISTGWRF